MARTKEERRRKDNGKTKKIYETQYRKLLIEPHHPQFKIQRFKRFY
jgi:hypothetical protein